MADAPARAERAEIHVWDRRVAAELDAIRAADRWRRPRDVDATGAVTGVVDGRPMVAFASNDYLGLSHHPAVVAAAHAALDRWGTGSGASRLVVGSRPIHGELEAALAGWKATEDAVLFPTGYAANLGVLASLGGPDVTVLSDELNHASLIDGCRLARAPVRVYRHADLDHLAKLLADVDGPALVVTDTVFSMDGDAADLPALADLAAAHGALLVLDEAHAVLGPDLPGAACPAPTRPDPAPPRPDPAPPRPDPAPTRPGPDGAPVLRVGTLSKTFGSLGGFVAGPRHFVDLLRNRARPFIFTTAPTPADMAAARAAVGIVASAEGDALRAALRRHVDRLRPGHPSPIIPVVLGDEAAALAEAARLEEQGLLVPAIRPPTVPPGTSRLRVALSAAHTDADIGRLASALGDKVRG
jgi:7-keto-8-aminopelargonate synthetase-like enzyme